MKSENGSVVLAVECRGAGELAGGALAQPRMAVSGGGDMRLLSWRRSS